MEIYIHICMYSFRSIVIFNKHCKRVDNNNQNRAVGGVGQGVCALVANFKRAPKNLSEGFNNIKYHGAMS